jgi:hydrogenase maturation protease
MPMGEPFPPGPGTIFVIGYGNTLRADDGAGPRVAARVSAWGWPGLTAIAVHLLAPELAEPLAAAELAIFVDARLADAGSGVEIVALEPSGSGGMPGHTSDPRSLLALAQALYGRHPRAWLVTLPAADLAMGERLSPGAERGVEAALAGIAALIERERPARPGGDTRGIPDAGFRIPDSRFQIVISEKHQDLGSGILADGQPWIAAVARSRNCAGDPGCPPRGDVHGPLDLLVRGTGLHELLHHRQGDVAEDLAHLRGDLTVEGCGRSGGPNAQPGPIASVLDP